MNQCHCRWGCNCGDLAARESRMSAALAGPQWSRKVPAEPGWWWVRGARANPEPLMAWVASTNLGLRVFLMGFGTTFSPADGGFAEAEWCRAEVPA